MGRRAPWPITLRVALWCGQQKLVAWGARRQDETRETRRVNGQRSGLLVPPLGDEATVDEDARVSEKSDRAEHFRRLYHIKKGVGRRCKILNLAVQRLKDGFPIGTEVYERWLLGQLVRLWRQMKDASANGRKWLVRYYGLSIAELDTYGRIYIERVKLARASGTSHLEARSAVIGARRKMHDYFDKGEVAAVLRLPKLLEQAGTEVDPSSKTAWERRKAALLKSKDEDKIREE
jgi:hypothetical protein